MHVHVCIYAVSHHVTGVDGHMIVPGHHVTLH